MTDTHIPENALVVVTTGTVAKFFRNTGSGGAINLEFAKDLEPADLNDDGPAGKRPPESSQQDTDEATFSKQLSEHLYTLAHHGKFDALVLVADPVTLGEVRPLLHKQVEEKVILELAKTLTGHQTDDIEKTLKAA